MLAACPGKSPPAIPASLRGCQTVAQRISSSCRTCSRSRALAQFRRAPGADLGRCSPSLAKSVAQLRPSSSGMGRCGRRGKLRPTFGRRGPSHIDLLHFPNAPLVKCPEYQKRRNSEGPGSAMARFVLARHADEISFPPHPCRESPLRNDSGPGRPFPSEFPQRPMCRACDAGGSGETGGATFVKHRSGARPTSGSWSRSSKPGPTMLSSPQVGPNPGQTWPGLARFGHALDSSLEREVDDTRETCPNLGGTRPTFLPAPLTATNSGSAASQSTSGTVAVQVLCL